MKIAEHLPQTIYARVVINSDGSRYLDTHDSAEGFDEEGIVGRYVLAERGEVTIETAFVSASRPLRVRKK